MKTAMSLALARIELMKDINTDSIHWEMFKNDCMEKEKEQIIDVHINGQSDPHFSLESRTIGAEDYYKQTYNQNK
jgi:hypothetical protein